MRHFIKPFLSFAAITSLGLWLVSIIAGACAQAGSPTAAQISEKSTFEWPVVAMLMIAAANYAANRAVVKGHIDNADIHPTKRGLDEVYRRIAECVLIHGEKKD